MTNPTGGVQPATQADLDAHTEQALVELVYVRVANEMIGSAMGNLQSALNVTQSILNILQAIQNLHNKVQVLSKAPFNFDFVTGGSPTTESSPVSQEHSLNFNQYIANYKAAADAYFGQAINPTFIFSSAGAAGFSQYASSLQTLKTNLQQEVSVLQSQTPAASQNDPASLLNTVKVVLNGLPAGNFAAIKAWAEDNYATGAGSSKAGQIQSDITFAITSAQSLNDSQKEKVRRFLFIFQEYYQSAAAVLTKIGQIITQMAQKISQ